MSDPLFVRALAEREARTLYGQFRHSGCETWPPPCSGPDGCACQTDIDALARALAEQDTAAHARGFAEAREMAARTAEEAPSNINSHAEWDAPTPGEIARAIRALTPSPPG